MSSEPFAVIVLGTLPKDDKAMQQKIRDAVESALLPMGTQGVYLEQMVSRFGESAKIEKS